MLALLDIMYLARCQWDANRCIVVAESEVAIGEAPMSSPSSGLQVAPEEGNEPSTRGFLPVLTPIISHARRRITKSIEKFAGQQTKVPFDPMTVDSLLLAGLLPSLLRIMGRTLVLELNVARMQGYLQGDTPAARFADYLNYLQDQAHFTAFLQEYPVLAQQLIQRVDQWLDASLEFLTRLSSDWDAIRAAFSHGHDPGMLVSLRYAGDAHRNGRNVYLLGFSSGLHLVYKPRPLSADVGFQALLSWLNDRGFMPGFRTLTVLAQEGYGWCEYVHAEECRSPAQLRRFYMRLGGYLALLYIIEATDFHFENVLAAGEHPVLVDLETLFHPRIAQRKSALAMHASAFENSVLRVGLLPHKRWQTAHSEGIDLSGLGAEPGQMTPFGVPQWHKAGTDEMHFVRRQMPLPSHRNRPLLNGELVDPLHELDAILEGFSTVYNLVARHSAAFLSDTGPLTMCSDAQVRVVLRPTQTYGVLLQESFHPDMLRNALDRDELLNRLWVQVQSHSYLAKVTPFEIADLQNGDIPYFTTYPSSQDIWNSTGERIPDFLDRPSMEHVRERVQKLGQNELDKQLWFIQASLATRGTRFRSQPRPYTPDAEQQEPRLGEDLLAVARSVGNRLESLSLRSANEVGWIGLTLRAKDQWSLAPLGLDLYDGLPGVALFLAYLGTITQEARYTELARLTVVTIQGEFERNLASLRTIGGFNGLGGTLYFLTHLSALWRESTLLKQAYGLLDLIAARIEQDEWFDIIAGAAGCIASLLGFYRLSRSDRALDLAVQCGDHLLRCSQAREMGIGWLNVRLAKIPLAGFSHGAAGIAWALSELTEMTGYERFRTAALAAVAYEDTLFSDAEGNWADLRELDLWGGNESTTAPHYTIAWCHGAPGIGLGRLYMLRHMHAPQLQAGTNSALQVTLARGFGANHCLCHGDLGNLEFIAQGARILQDRQWHDHAQAFTSAILARIRSDGWQCGNPLKVESPGLMTGLAGIGYGLMRMAAPERIPSVLMLEPPIE
jgi:type 2 lantibiotic biosynthesis protein LanM